MAREQRKLAAILAKFGYSRMKHDDTFRPNSREIEAMVRRITAAGETFSIAGSREDAGFLLLYFPTWAKASHAALDRPQ